MVACSCLGCFILFVALRECSIFVLRFCCFTVFVWGCLREDVLFVVYFVLWFALFWFGFSVSAGEGLLLLVCVVLFCGFRVFMIWVCDRASDACKVCVSLVFEFCWWSASFTYALFL